jgi:hypothetical protein
MQKAKQESPTSPAVKKPSNGSVSLQTYKLDVLYPKIVRAVDAILQTGSVVAPVDVLVRMNKLDAKRLEEWRRGQVPYLERLILGNLTQFSSLLRILRFHAHDLNLKPSFTAYTKWGKGPKTLLRFTRTSDKKLEEVYATHFIKLGKKKAVVPTVKVEDKVESALLASEPLPTTIR